MSNHIKIIYEKWVAWIKSKLYLNSLTLSDFEIWSSPALKAFNNHSKMMTNNSDNIEYDECSAVVSC